jgi:MFS family permease
MRVFQDLFGCVGTILVGGSGTFSDIYRPDHRAVPMACFSYVAILGTVGAPIYARFINETIGWRWIEGTQGLSNVPLLAVIALCLLETRGGVTLHRRAKHSEMQQWTTGTVQKWISKLKTSKKCSTARQSKLFTFSLLSPLSLHSVCGLRLLSSSPSCSCQLSRLHSRRNEASARELRACHTFRSALALLLVLQQTSCRFESTRQS